MGTLGAWMACMGKLLLVRCWVGDSITRVGDQRAVSPGASRLCSWAGDESPIINPRSQKAEADFLCGQRVALFFLPALQKATNSWSHCGKTGESKNRVLKKKERKTVLFPPLYEIACQIIDWGLALLLCRSLSAAETASYLGPDVLPLIGLWGPGGLLADADSLCLVKDGANRRCVHVILTLRGPGLLSSQTCHRAANSRSGTCK